MAGVENQGGNGLKVIRYLDDHRLEHTPEHYLFGHRVLFGTDTSFRQAVKHITDGGVRITPTQVHQLSIKQIGAGQAIREFAPELDGLTLRVLDIAGEAAAATGELNRDLVQSMAAMLGPQATDVRPIINAMIDHTSAAETRLAEVSRQAAQLRDDLTALHDDASRDRLTGLLNRAAIEERLSTAARGPTSYSVAIINVDRLHAINAEYGYAVGDRILKAVADILRERCSPYPVARWAGGEFMALFAAIAPTDAAEFIEDAREILAQRRMKLRENDRPLGTITFSAGVVYSRSRESAKIIEAADRLVRDAKDQGRNSVVIEQATIGL